MTPGEIVRNQESRELFVSLVEHLLHRWTKGDPTNLEELGSWIEASLQTAHDHALQRVAYRMRENAARNPHLQARQPYAEVELDSMAFQPPLIQE